MKLDTYKDLVKELLTDYPQRRGNDRKLYLALIWKLGYKLDVSIKDFFNDDSYPSYESIGRCRRKAQEEHPELLPEEKIQAQRQEAQEEFIQFARERG